MNKKKSKKILGVLLMPLPHLTVEAMDTAETDVIFVLLVEIQMSGEFFLLNYHNFILKLDIIFSSS